MKNTSEVYKFFLKNIKEIIHSFGYKIVKIKKQNSKKIATRLAKQNRISAAVFNTNNCAILIRKNKYFSVQVDARAGINHLREALEWLVRESISLNRTPLVFTPHFDTCHNFNIEVNATWDRYIDLNNLKISKLSLEADTSIQAVMHQNIVGFDDLSMLCIERDHVISDIENEEFDLIVRHNKNGLKIDSIHTGIRGIPNYSVFFKTSNRVFDIYKQVSNKIENISAIHVRRGDMLNMLNVYPNLNQETHPDNIRTIISEVIPTGSKIYILTNETDKAYFNSLKIDYEVFQYFDFPELLELVECEQPDNFLLFEVEKLIFEKAKTKIYTFTHPEGASRISLSSHLGWA